MKRLINTGLALGLIVVGMFAATSHAEDFNGGLGGRYATSARTVPVGFFRLTGHSRGAQIELTTTKETINYLSGAFSLNYGVTENLELELTSVMYQDKSSQAAGNKYPTDFYLRWKLGSYKFVFGSLPLEYGIQLSTRMDFYEPHNVPFEPYGGIYVNHQVNSILSYYRNPYDPGSAMQVHYNLGLALYNDVESNYSIKSYLAMIFPLSHRLDYILESHGMFVPSAPPNGTKIYGIEEYIYLTSSLRYRFNPSLYLTSGLDVLGYEQENLTTRSVQPRGYPNYPEWRVTSSLTYIPRLSFTPAIRKIKQYSPDLSEAPVKGVEDLPDVCIQMSGFSMEATLDQIELRSTRPEIKAKIDGNQVSNVIVDLSLEPQEETLSTEITNPVTMMDYRSLELKLSLPGYETIKDRVVVTPGETRSVNFTLHPRKESRKEALWRSALLPGAGQRYNDQKTWGWIITAAQVASLAFSAYATLDYQGKQDDYESAKHEYERAVSLAGIRNARDKMIDTRDKMHRAADLTDWSYVITSGIYCFNLLDVAYWDGGKIKVGHK